MAGGAALRVADFFTPLCGGKREKCGACRAPRVFRDSVWKFGTPRTWRRRDAGDSFQRLRRRVLHHCRHLGTETCGRIQCDRCRLVIRMHKVEPLEHDLDVYVYRLDWPIAPQNSHRVGDCRRRGSHSEVVICERKNNRTELDAPGIRRRGKGNHSLESARWAATGLLVDEDGICT